MLVPGFAYAAPGIPEAFHGTAGGTAGVHITASIQGIIVASTTTQKGGIYGLAPHLFLVSDANGVEDGALVSFALNGTPALQTALYERGAIVALDLFVAQAKSNSGATAVASLIPHALPVATVRHASSTHAYIDITGDTHADMFDFAMLLARWGSGGVGTPADLNRDGVVDLIDFNTLISHWDL